MLDVRDLAQETSHLSSSVLHGSGAGPLPVTSFSQCRDGDDGSVSTTSSSKWRVDATNTRATDAADESDARPGCDKLFVWNGNADTRQGVGRTQFPRAGEIRGAGRSLEGVVAEVQGKDQGAQHDFVQ